MVDLLSGSQAGAGVVGLTAVTAAIMARATMTIPIMELVQTRIKLVYGVVTHGNVTRMFIRTNVTIPEEN